MCILEYRPVFAGLDPLALHSLIDLRVPFFDVVDSPVLDHERVEAVLDKWKNEIAVLSDSGSSALSKNMDTLITLKEIGQLPTHVKKAISQPGAWTRHK
jgi:hypothetical protein